MCIDFVLLSISVLIDWTGVCPAVLYLLLSIPFHDSSKSVTIRMPNDKLYQMHSHTEVCAFTHHYTDPLQFPLTVGSFMLPLPFLFGFYV